MAIVEKVPTSEENHFQLSGNTIEPRVSDTNTYTDMLGVNKYVYMDHAYYGSGGFRDGTYLIPHDREMFYLKRRNFSVYKNCIKPIINSLVDPVFSEPAPRVIVDGQGGDEGSPIARAFIEDVDSGGTNMQSFSKGVLHSARRHGVSFIVMDNYTQDQMPSTVAEAVNARIYPYIIKKSAWEVVETKTDEFGRLQEISFAEPDRVDGNHVYKRCRLWTADYSIILEKEKNSNLGTATDDKSKWVPVGPPVYHNLGVVPVVQVYACERDSLHNVLPDPPMYDVARLNSLIYNKDSEIRDIERSSSFPVLYYQSDMGGNITISNHNAIVVPMGSTMSPGYISPESSIVTALMDTNKFYMEDLFRSAEQSGVHAVQTTQSPSGVALAWRFWAVENALKETARVATIYEIQVMDLLKLYTGEEYEYAVEYPSTYQPGDQMQQITGYKTVMDMSPPDALKEIMYKKIAKIIMADDPEDERDAVIEAMATEPVEPVATTSASGAPEGGTTDTEDTSVTAEVEDTKPVAEYTKPVTTGKEEGGGGLTGEGLLPETVLNGAQVTALVDLCQRVLDGFPRDSAIQIAQVAFGLTPEKTELIVPQQGSKPVDTKAVGAVAPQGDKEETEETEESAT